VRATLALAATAILLLGCSRDVTHLRDVLFQATRHGGTEDTYALHLADLTTRRLIKGDSASSRGFPAWSPDGRSIAYVREFDDHDQIYILDTIGGEPRQVAAGLGLSAHYPDWSPDGRSMLFTAGRTIEHDGVYLIGVDGSGLRPVLGDSINEYRYPSWAPNGRQFAVSRWSPSGSAILVVDVASGAARQVLSADTVYLDCPQWSPKGDQLLLTVYLSDVYPWKSSVTEARADLAVLDLHSGGLRFVTTDRDKLNNYGRWSRDARWIVFQSDRHAPPFRDSAATHFRFDSLEIYIVRPDGSGLRRLTSNTYFDAHPSW
jgi:Tol biopolymer transport system component